jgi:hypothetical protein
MITLLGSTNSETENEVRRTKCAHVRFVYLKETITRQPKVLKKARKEKDQENGDTYKLYVMRAYLLLLVGTSIFSNKVKNYVDLTYLAYFRNLDLVGALFLWHCCTDIPILGVVKCHSPELQICGWLHDTPAGNIYLI